MNITARKETANESRAALLSHIAARPVAQKLWLWKNFVDGRPEYWAFDNPYPVNLDNGDPQTLGEPCGYALFKPSRQGRTDVSEEQVLRAIDIAAAKGAASAPVTQPPEAEKVCHETYAAIGCMDLLRRVRLAVHGPLHKPGSAPGVVPSQVQSTPTEPLTHCAADRDGECCHPQCPQIRDGEPAKTGRHCPIDNREDY